MKNLTLIILSVFVFTSATVAQIFPSIDYPRGYFRSPLGIPLQLSANFGELRTNHYHMGFDIRTQQRENLPVYAAAEGYVSKVKIERYGYGRVIYINHPNGYTTLYAHLNDFYPALNNYVIEKQYRDEQWEQEIDFTPDQFPVTKGQFIAYSGNTGGSAGPHLHFEIRDTKTGNNINPWLFGSFNMTDRIEPYIYKLYYYDRRYSTYQLGPNSIGIKGGNGKYVATDNIVELPTPTVSFGITAEDKTNSSPFLFGIYQAELWVDDSLRNAFKLDNFSYTETRYMNAAIDYSTRINNGRYIQHLSRLPGNQSSVFSRVAGDGVIITDTLVHKAEIVVKDVAGNTSTLSFNFRYNPNLDKGYSFAQNYIPLLPNQENVIKFPGIEVLFPATAFYHMVPFVYAAKEATDKATVSAIHTLHNPSVPVHESYTVRLQSNLAANDPLRDRVVMQFTNNKKKIAVKGPWSNNWMEAKFIDLGEVRLLIDTIAPTVSLSGWANGSNVSKRKSIAFVVKDDVGEIKSFRAEVDGKWIMFRRRSDSFIHDFDGRVGRGRHQLRVVVEDEAGNITERVYTFVR